MVKNQITEKEIETAIDEVKQDIGVLLKGVEREIELDILSRYLAMYIVTFEEDRVLKIINDICNDRRSKPSLPVKKVKVWSLTKGLRDYSAYLEDDVADDETTDPIAALEKIMSDESQNSVYVMLDMHPMLANEDANLIRKLKDCIGRLEKEGRKTLVFVSPILKLPEELTKLVTVTDYDLPTREELNGKLDEIVAGIVSIKKTKKVDVETNVPKEIREKAIRSVMGLTLQEAARVMSKSFVSLSRLDPAFCLREKKDLVRKMQILEYQEASNDFNDVGGLGSLKTWIKNRSDAFSEEAREYGLPTPKGMLLTGIPGTGKSLVAKALGKLLELPILRFDVGKVFGPTVGTSEQQIRQVMQMAEAMSPCILYIDEIEKGFAGVQSSTFSDSGTTARVFGSFISWLQEKTAPVFVVATANDVTQLPPELLRKGRFDEIFFVDLPTKEEREEILKIHLKKHNLDVKEFDVPNIAEQCKNYNGAEIEQLVIESLYKAFGNGREKVKESHILESVEETVPLATTMAEKIRELREWAKIRARFASGGDNKKASKNMVSIEI